MKKQIVEKKGITLIALVITIIVLLILAGITIATLTGDNGILKQVDKAKTETTMGEEKEAIGLAYNGAKTEKLGGVITAGDLNTQFTKNGIKATASGEGTIKVDFETGRSYTLDAHGIIEEWIVNSDGSFSKGSTSGVQVGDIVKYETKLTAKAVDGDKKSSLITDLGRYSGNTDTSQNTDSSVVRDSLTWKVLDVKDGKIRLISAVPTTSKIRLYNADGYNNAVYLLDKACDTLYSIDGVGKAQNLKIEDIEEKIDKTKFDYTQYANSYVDTGKYGETKEYTSNLQYPNIYSSEVGCKAVATADNTGNTLGLSVQTSPVTGRSIATNRLKVTQTYWKKSMANTDFTDSKYYNLFINNGAIYWLSSRCVLCYSSCAGFDVRVVSNSGNVSSCNVFYSNVDTYGEAYAFRPVVSLESNIQLSGDSTNGWTIQ